VGNGNGHGGNSCSCCQNKLVPVKLYAPEILRVFPSGKREYSRNGILTSFSICMSHMCKEGKNNLESYERVLDQGMIRQE
jgi:hypothetical protein